MKKIVIVGAGGHCKVVIDIIRSTKEFEIAGVTDIESKGSVLGIPIIGDDSILKKLYDEGVKYAFVGIGALDNMDIRNEICSKLKSIGFHLPILIHSAAVVSPFSKIEKGTCVMAGSIVNADAEIGENCIINTGSIVEHDCKIGFNTHVSPNACIAGNVSIGFNTHIGLGSSIIQGIFIGNNVTIGAGAVVIHNIDDNAVAVGVPAKVIKVK